MRNIILIFLAFLYNGIMPIHAQSNLSDYLMSNDIKGFMQSCNQNEEFAIESLITFYLNDTIDSRQIWYNQTTGKGINPFEKSTEGLDKFYVSIKLKSYCWILQIFNSEYSCVSDCLCVFIGNNNDIIFDYEIINQAKQNQLIKEILTGECGNQKVIFLYKKMLSINLKELNRSFENWFRLMKEKGLDYMREQNIPPIKEKQYKIFIPNLINFKI